MKKIIIAITFLFFIMPAIGQDTLRIRYGVGSGYIIDSFANTGSYGKPARDTIPVIMLICDTSHYIVSWMELKSCNDVGCTDTTGKHKWASHYVEKKEDIGKRANGTVFWMVGYSVREFSGYYNANTSQFGIYIAKPYYEHTEYLGEDKKPLANKIVWMAKEIK